MSLLHASLAAAGIACIAIPIIIHLLMHRRRRPVMWGAMRFLLEAYRRQRRRLMLEKWLLLACRCLVIALLALAIGRPFIGRVLGAGAGRTLYLLVDNSLTSGVRGPDGTAALEHHKAAAKAAIEALHAARIGGAPGSEGDRVALIALGGPPEPVVMPPSADLAAVARLIDDLQPTASRADIPGAIQMVADALSGAAPDDERGSKPASAANDGTYVAIFSDFRDGSLDLSPGGSSGGSTITAKLPAGVTLLATSPATGERVNTAITGVEPLRSVVVSGSGADSETGEGNSLVRVLLRRHGESLGPATTTVQTRVVWPAPGPSAPGTPAAVAAPTQTTVRWAQGQDSAMVVVSLPRGGGEGGGAAGPVRRAGAAAGAIVASIDDDALAGDNTWRRPVEFREALRVGIIAPTRFASGLSADKLSPGTWARLALAPAGEGTGGIEVVDIEPASIDAARLAGLDAVILPRPDLIQDSGWARIGLFASSGGVVLVTPPPDVRVHLWPDAMVRGLGLSSEWSLGREPRAVGDTKLAAPPPVPAPGSPSGMDQSSIASGLLALVAGELDTLLRPVNVKTALPIDSTGDTGRVILRLEGGGAGGGAPILWAGRPGDAAGGRTGTTGVPIGESRGLVVYLGIALSLDWSDLPAKPLMVPLMQEIVRQGVGQARGSWWMVAGSKPLTPAGAVELRPIDERPIDSRGRGASETAREPGAEGVISLTSPESAGPLRRAGVFAAIDDRGGTRALIAVNPDPRAGNVEPQPQESVGKLLSAAVNSRSDTADAPARSIVWLPADGTLDPSATASGPGGEGGEGGVQGVMSGLFGASERGTPIDLPLLIAALALAIVEIGLARWASHAEVLPAAVRQAAGAITAGVVGGGDLTTGDAA